jgi:sodium/potassium/calcium exchanger 6
MKREPWLLLATGIVGFTAACLVAVFGSHGENSTARLLRTCMGFFTAMVWIMAIADEVVGVLQARLQS